MNSYVCFSAHSFEGFLEQCQLRGAVGHEVAVPQGGHVAAKGFYLLDKFFYACPIAFAVTQRLHCGRVHHQQGMKREGGGFVGRHIEKGEGLGHAVAEAYAVVETQGVVVADACGYQLAEGVGKLYLQKMLTRATDGDAAFLFQGLFLLLNAMLNVGVVRGVEADGGELLQLLQQAGKMLGLGRDVAVEAGAEGGEHKAQGFRAVLLTQLTLDVVHIVGVLIVGLTLGFDDLRCPGPLQGKQRFAQGSAEMPKTFALEGVGDVDIKGGKETVRGFFPLVSRLLLGKQRLVVQGNTLHGGLMKQSVSHHKRLLVYHAAMLVAGAVRQVFLIVAQQVKRKSGFVLQYQVFVLFPDVGFKQKI